MLQKIHDALVGGPEGAPPLKALNPYRTPPVPIRTRMATPPDVAIALDSRAAAKLSGRHWRRSLPALLAVMGVEDTAARRDALAGDLNLDLSGLARADADAALHAALMQRLAQTDVMAPQDFYK
jgi:hypothetical protein